MSTSFDLREAFAAKQKHMLSGLGLMPNFTNHPTAKGDATEERWIRMLSDFLPRRYGVGSVFAIDSYGKQSQQIDVAIYDRQYSPLFFEQGDLTFVPVESIYAIFEAKPELSKDYVDYAREKIASVRSLRRTSVGIRHAGGTYPPQEPANKPILGGLLATETSWTDIQGKAARKALLTGSQSDRLDFAIAVRDGAVERVGEVLVFAGGATLDLLVPTAERNRQQPGLTTLYAVASATANDPAHDSHGYFKDRYSTMVDRLGAEIKLRQQEGQVRADVPALDLARLVVAVFDRLQLQWLYDKEVDVANGLSEFIEVLLQRQDQQVTSPGSPEQSPE